MKHTFRIWVSSTAVLVAVILALALGADASPANTGLVRAQIDASQSTFSVGHDDELEVLAVGAENEIGDYAGYQVWRINLLGGDRALAQGVDTAKAAKHVMEVAQLLDLDVWHTSRSHIDILLSPEIKSHFFSLIPHDLHPGSPLVDSDLLQTLLSRPGRKHRKRPPPSQPPIPSPPIDPFNLTTLQSPYHDAYHPLSNITQFGKQLEKTFPGLVKRFTVGKSAEGRDVEGLRLHKFVNTTEEDPEEWSPRTLMGRNKGRAEEAKTRVFYLQGGQHAREWIAPASLLYFAHHLLVQASQNNSPIVHLLETYEFVIVPTINPDGYEYSREHSRLWRKNRQDLDFRNCKGIDMNSNWGYQWSPNMLASNPCSEAYPGSAAFEAVETKLVADFLEELKEIRDVRAFVDIHSYGQLFMFPYAYSCSDFPGDAETLMEAGLGVAKALRSVHGTVYQSGQACDLVYRMSGDSIDYAYGSAKIRWSYSVELRDTGTFGFLLPPHLIRETAAEITEGLVYLAKFINAIEGFEQI